MHPAPSIIVFTVLSGLGFGLMAVLGLRPLPEERWVAAIFAGLAMGLATAGLLASTFHLRHPERALLAFTQWRSSWLSREAILSVAALAAFAVYAGLHVATGLHVAPLGWLVAVLAGATVLATGMIYAQMRSVPRWLGWRTVALFLAHSAAGGLLLSGQTDAALAALGLLALCQLAVWHHGDRIEAATLATSDPTGLARLGTARQVLPAHTAGNYLMREMMFWVGRRHARRLRWIGLVLAVAIPAAALAAGYGHLTGGLAVAAHIAGSLVLRWLFFAEARHVVGLYYGLTV